MVEWFERKLISLDEVSDDERKKEILEEFRIKLKSLTSLELDHVARNLDFTKLFSQLTSNDKIYLEEVCNNLSTLFSILEAGEIHKKYPNEIIQFISHQESLVKTLVLKELIRTASLPEKVDQLINDSKLLNLVAEKIGGDDLVVAKLAMDVLKKVGKSSAGAKILYSSTILRTLARLLSKKGIIGFRVYEVVVEIAMNSKEGLEASSTSGFLNSLISVLADDDVLLQLNALEIMADLASTDYGLDYLEKNNVLKKLNDKIIRVNEVPLSPILIPGLMKFFGKISKTRVEIFSKYPQIMLALFEVINETEDQILLGNALDTLGHIATTSDGKYALQNFGQLMKNAINKINQVINKMPSELKIRGLNCLALLLYVEKTLQNNQIMSLTKNWFDLIDTEPLKMIVELCRQPFFDIQLSSYRVLAAISNQTWGHEIIATYPGLIELLLERNTDFEKDVKEIKYLIIKNLSEASIDIFDSGTLQKFTHYIRQGPFFVDFETDVATEGAT